MEGWLFGGVMVFAVVAYFVMEKRAKAEVAARFAGRPPLDFESLYKKYYSGSVDKVLVRELLEHAAHELAVPAQKLRPEDSFEHELKPTRGWEFDSGRNALLTEVARLGKPRGKEIEISAIRTLDDYIRAMAKVY